MNERELFEADYKRRTGTPVNLRILRNGNEYLDGVDGARNLNVAWEAWQARAALAAQPAITVEVDGLAEVSATVARMDELATAAGIPTYSRMQAIVRDRAQPAASAEPQQDRFKPPFDNCSFKLCDLQGQCRGEGKCHHPGPAAALAARKPDGGASRTLHHYGDVLQPFVQIMAAELLANAGKGDRPGWLSCSADALMLEVYYHAAKLQKAVKDGNRDGIREYSADVANLAMMVLDVCGGIGAAISAQQRQGEGE